MAPGGDGMRAEKFLSVGAVLAECPVWDAASGSLYFIDITSGRVYRHAVGSGETAFRDMGGLVGMIAPAPGGLIAAVDKDIVSIAPPLHGNAKPLVRGIERDDPATRFNDGKCDAKGRLWIGTMHKTAGQGRAAFYRVTADGGVQRVFGGVTVSNGVGWSPDNRFLYHVDTPSGHLMRYEFDLESGRVSGGVRLIDYRDEPGDFDGMAVDAQGALWVCHWGGFRVSQWDPLSGEKQREILLPVPNVTCCCFGEGGLLYITTGTGRDGRLRAQYPDLGCLYACRTDAQGGPVYHFAPPGFGAPRRVSEDGQWPSVFL